MTLERLLGKVVLLSGLSLFSYNCQSVEPDSTSCVKDTDCKGERVCNDGKCVENSTYSSTSNQYTCESYLNNIIDCCNQGKFPSDDCTKVYSISFSEKQEFLNSCNNDHSKTLQCMLDCLKKNKERGKYCDYGEFRYCDEKLCTPENAKSGKYKYPYTPK